MESLAELMVKIKSEDVLTDDIRSKAALMRWKGCTLTA